MTNKETIKLLVWLLSDDTGTSSKNILRRFLNLPIESFGWPHDASDFGRCYRLLRSCSFIDIPIMKDVDRVWADLIDKWQEITRLYETNKSRDVYDLINSIEKKYQKNGTLIYCDIQLEYSNGM